MAYWLPLVNHRKLLRALKEYQAELVMLSFICAFVFVDPPVALSPPHFYQGNKSLVEAVHGLNPQKSLHETFADIEPVRRNLKPLGYVAFSGAGFMSAKGGISGTRAARARVLLARSV